MKLWIILLLMFLIFDLVVVVIVFIKRARGRKFSEHDINYVRDHWLEVEAAYEEEDYQAAVIDADKILDYALMRRGFHGSIGEKLQSAYYLFSDLNGIWSAHKMRNRMAHELGEVDERQVRDALKKFKQAFHDLGVKF